MTEELELLALNQTLFRKSFIIGEGFQEGNQSYADETINDGWYVFVNGKTIIPEDYGEIKELYTIGTMYCNDLLTGTSSNGGYVRYSLGITNHAYLIIAGVKLGQYDDDETDFTEEIAVFMFINRMPSPMFRNGELTIQKLAKELLMSHFLVFLGTDNPEVFSKQFVIDETEENSVLIEALEEFIERMQSKEYSEKTISEEVKDIINKMNDLSADND